MLGSLSGNVTISAEAKCRSLEASAYKKVFKLEANLIIGTSTSNGGLALKFGTGMTLEAGTSTIEFVSSSGTEEGIYIGGRLPYKLKFHGKGGKWGIHETLKWTNHIELSEGTLNTNGWELNGSTFESIGSGTCSLSLSSSLVVINNVEFAWLMENTKMTLSAGTSTIELTGSTAAKRRFRGGSFTYHNVIIAHEDVEITGSNTFANLTLNTAGTNPTLFQEGTTQTITESLRTNGSSGKLCALESTVAGKEWKLSKASGTIIFDYLKLKDSHVGGGAKWYAGTHSENVSNNSGWEFEAPGGTVVNQLGSLGAISGAKATASTLSQVLVAKQSLTASKATSTTVVQQLAQVGVLAGKKAASGGATQAVGLRSTIVGSKTSRGALILSSGLRDVAGGSKMAMGALTQTVGTKASLIGSKDGLATATQALSLVVTILGERNHSASHIIVVNQPQAQIMIISKPQAEIIVVNQRQAKITIESE